MQWLHYLSYFGGALFFTNAIPHFVSGMMGRAFQSPFANPPGRGLSSSQANIVWGSINLVIGYLLTFQVGHFNVRGLDILPFGIGVFGAGMLISKWFGQFHGGNLPLAEK